jgi:hypothetical protein
MPKERKNSVFCCAGKRGSGGENLHFMLGKIGGVIGVDLRKRV